MSTLYYLGTVFSEFLKSNRSYEVLAILANASAILASAFIAAGAAILAAWFTMRNARALQDRERSRDAQSVAALLSMDLHKKLSMLVRLLPQLNDSHVDVESLGQTIIALEQKLASRVVLEAALPKLGSLGHQDSASLLGAFDGLAQVVAGARAVVEAGRPEQNPVQLVLEMKETANHIGIVLFSLWRRYEIDRPTPLEESGLDPESRGVEFLKTLGI